MRTVNYSDVLRGSAALCGLGKDDIGLAEFALLRGFHDRRLQEAWEIHEWPDLCRVEQRLFRPKWRAGIAYGAGDERYDVAAGNYYQSLHGTNTDNAPTIDGAENSAHWAQCNTSYGAVEWSSGAVYAVGDKVKDPADQQYYQCITGHTSGATRAADSDKWGGLTAFDRYVAFDQQEDDGQTVYTSIGDFLGATDVNPYLTTKQVDYPFIVSEKGAQFYNLKHAISFAWIWLRMQRPVLSGEPYDATATYGPGDQVYFVHPVKDIGNFYTAQILADPGESPYQAPDKWAVVAIPYIFRGWLIQAGYADWLTSDGQGDKATAAEGLAMNWLELEADKLQRQSGQVRRVVWKR